MIKSRTIGNPELKISQLCLGTMMFGDATDVDEAGKIFSCFSDAGGNFIDTADVYAGGKSEQIVGGLVKNSREKYIVATKGGNKLRDVERSGGISAKWIASAVEQSLARLNTDYIDIYYLHLDDMVTPLEETIQILGQMIRQGKIRSWGFSNFRPWKIAEMVRVSEQLDVAPPIIAQPYYHLLNRVVEADYIPACAHFDIAVVPYSPLARGVLTGKYSGGRIPEQSRVARGDQRVTEMEFLPATLAAAEKAANYASAKSKSLADLAVQWVLANKSVTAILAGPRTVEQMEAYIEAMNCVFDADDEQNLSALCPPGQLAAPGHFDPRYPLDGRIVNIEGAGNHE